MSKAAIANTLTERVQKLVGTTDANRIRCPREHSPMTPCIARDGHTALADDERCVGCNGDPVELLADFVQKHG